ncbi:MAG: cytochrome C [Ignavibacteria bacterium]|nr:cytochrome C [Ignavibacteria bacterium]
MFAQSQPIPRDIPLPLPMPEWLLVFLLIISFLLHILFVNLMLGGTLLTFILQIMGLKKKKYDRLAREIEITITVNKSLAVVIGVAPLLIINTLYTLYFYSANALTGYAWISIIPLVIIAFLILYYHKYKWIQYENKKKKHIAILGIALIVLLFVPLIFLSNISLMLFPERWADVRGFFSSLLIENVIPRYLHFLTGTVAVTGLFIFGYFGRKSYPIKEKLPDFTKDEIKEKAYKLTFYATLSQLVFGPLLFFTLPWHGVDWNLAYIIIAGVLIAAVAMTLLWLELKRKELGKRFIIIIILISITVLLMGWGRHTYRANVIEPHKKLMQDF